MFKKVILHILLLSLIILCPPIHASVYLNVDNTSVGESIPLSHSVDRISYFKLTTTNAPLNRTTDTQLCTFWVKNNTRDGFKVEINSLNGGNLKPATSEDGETDIPYSIKITKIGTIGDGINGTYSHSSASLANTTAILNKSGSVVTSPTDAEFDIIITIIDNENKMEMAGTYTDTLTITYTDL